MIFFSIFKNKRITVLYGWGMLIVFMLVVMFTLLIVRDEYINFDKEIISVKSKYMEDQKEIISFDINRVMRYVEYKYKNRDKNRSTSDLQKEVLTTIEQLYGRKDGTGYIFIYDFKGKNLSDPLDFDNINRNLYDFKDPNGVYVIRDLINVSKEKDGGFVEYMWVKSASGTPMKKISYAKAFMPWGWMIGTGFYLDEVEAIISVHKAELKARLIKFMMEILSITAVMFTIGLVGLGIINYLISKEINTFKKFFKEAATRHTTIDENEIHINEFKKMVRYINEMVDTIHARKQNLKDINLSLEKRVEQKTKDLIEQNILLEKEKKFNISLIKSQDSFIKHSIHEINTPLAVIMMHIDIRKMKFGEDKYMSKIEAASKMISNIYEDLSYMVKKDRFTYEKQWIFFSKFLEERIDFFEDIAKGNRHNIVYDIDKDIKILFSDIELQRVVDNNLSNAIKYANKDSDIKVRLKRNRRQVILEFETFSKQIENTRKIFEPFHQEEDEHGGFGLGLEIVCSICKKENVLYEVTSAPEVTIFRYTFSNIL